MRTSLAAPGLLLGVGLGAFVDGIVLHQLLRWHHMLSAVEPVTTVAGLQANVLADGLFHVGAWLAVAAGVAVLARRPRPWPSAALWGWAVAGWGGFDVVEGLVNHQLLGVHHVRDGSPHEGWWDAGFLALGVVLAVGGTLVARRAEQRAERRTGRRTGRQPA